VTPWFRNGGALVTEGATRKGDVRKQPHKRNHATPPHRAARRSPAAQTAHDMFSFCVRAKAASAYRTACSGVQPLVPHERLSCLAGKKEEHKHGINAFNPRTPAQSDTFRPARGLLIGRCAKARD